MVLTQALRVSDWWLVIQVESKSPMPDMATFKKAVKNMFSPQQDKQGEEDENHQMFSILSLLLTLVAVINGRHPMLIGSGVVCQRLHQGKDNKAQLVMDSILAILVKDTEVMACMTYWCHHGKAGT